MALPFLTPSRCVLLIGDEGLHVYNVTFSGVRLVDTVPWQADDFETVVVGLIRKDCRSKPVMVLNDMTDQHFRGGQRLPRVGPMDRASVLQRKLQVAFPNYPIRGALAVKEPKERTHFDAAVSTGVKPPQEGLYLFAAVPMSEAVSSTMEALKNSLASIAGFCLLPIEAADMVQVLAKKLAGKSGKPARWVIFMGQHHGGALRQVITRDGQLAMTRMTPVTDNDTDPAVWAQEVFQEFKSTIGYLSRFGFSPSDGTDVVVIGDKDAGQELEKLIDVPCHYVALTVQEAARNLGVGIGVQPDTRYADPLHVAWTGRKSRFALPMKVESLDKINQPRQIVALAVLLLILGGAYLSWQVTDQFQTLMAARDNTVVQQRSLNQATTENDDEVARLKGLGVDVKLIRAATKTFRTLDDKRLHELVLMNRIGDALGEELRLDDLKIGVEDQVKANPMGMPQDDAGQNATEKKAPFKASLTLSFPSSVDPENGAREINNLKRRLESKLPGCSVSIEKNIAGLEYNESFSGSTQRASDQAALQNRSAEITIRGTIE